MRVCFISTNHAWGGSENLWSAAALRACESGFNVFIGVHAALLDQPILSSLSKAGANLFSLEDCGATTSSILLRAARRALGHRLCRSGNENRLLALQLDCICVSQGTWDEILWQHELCELVLKARVPYVCLLRSDSARGKLSFNQRELGREFYTHAAFLVSASKSTVEIAEISLACSLDNTVVLHSPIRHVPLKTSGLIEGAPITVGCIGRLQCDNKGQHFLLRALALPQWKSKSWELRFYGSGPDRDYLQELIICLGLQDRVRLMGHEPDLYKIMSSCDIFVQPSIVEGMPQSVLEAMACGKPVVATEVGGISDWINDGDNGFLACSPLPKHLCIALENAWREISNWEAIGSRAKQTILACENRDPAQALLDMLKGIEM